MPETPEFKQVEDKNEAEESAYAEKPYRDAAAEYGEKLSPEAKQALDWIASQEGEKAIEAYRSRDASQKETAARILKEKTLDAIVLRRASPDSYVIHEEESGGGWEREEWDGLIEDINELEKRVAEPEIETLLSSAISPQEKQRQLKDLIKAFRDVASGNFDFLNNRYDYEAILARELAMGGTMYSLDRILGDFTQRELGGISQYMDLITEVRSGKVATKAPDSSREGRNKKIDGVLEGLGYHWDEKTKKYARLG